MSRVDPELAKILAANPDAITIVPPPDSDATLPPQVGARLAVNKAFAPWGEYHKERLPPGKL